MKKVVIACALKSEAKPFIRYLGLKKDLSSKIWQIYRKDSFLLIKTGIGKVKAASAVSYILAMEEKNKPILVNVGFAGSKKESCLGKFFLINKVIDSLSKREFYPDIFVKHNWRETSLETHPSEVKEEGEVNDENSLVDMEGSAVFESASFYLPPEQIIILKLCSDVVGKVSLTKYELEALLEKECQEIFLYVKNLQEALNKEFKKYLLEDKAVSSLKNRFLFTKSQEEMLKKGVKLCVYQDKNKVEKVLDKFLTLPAPLNKKERDRIFKDIKDALFS